MVLLEARTRVHLVGHPDRLGWVMPAGSSGYWGEELNATQDELVAVFRTAPFIDDGRGWCVVWWGPDRMDQRWHRVEALEVVAPPPHKAPASRK